MPEEETCFSWYRRACEYLEENGYIRYTAGDFCLPQRACRYALAALDAPARLGLGLGAVSCLDGFMTRNTNNSSIYLTHAGDFEKTTAEAFSVDQDSLMWDYVEHRLHSPAGFSLADFASRFGCMPPEALTKELTERIDQGLLRETQGVYTPSERGLYSALLLRSPIFTKAAPHYAPGFRCAYFGA